MLRDLLDTEPESQLECAAGVDEVIEYLERNVTAADTYKDQWSEVLYAFNGQRWRY